MNHQCYQCVLVWGNSCSLFAKNTVIPNLPVSPKEKLNTSSGHYTVAHKDSNSHF